MREAEIFDGRRLDWLLCAVEQNFFIEQKYIEYLLSKGLIKPIIYYELSDTGSVELKNFRESGI